MKLYKANIEPGTGFVFIGKKIAIFNVTSGYNETKRISIAGYLKRIKSQLGTYGFSSTDFTYTLTPEQKMEAGGYDIIIQYRSKKGLSLTDLIKKLKKPVHNLI